MTEVREPPLPRLRPLRILLRVVLSVAVVAALLVVALAAFLPTQTALEIAIARTERASEGRLKVIGATGSLTSTVHVEELRWQGPELTLVAHGVALDWSPRQLLSRRLEIAGLGAQTLSIESSAKDGNATLPASLALPLDVAIAHLGIGRLDWVIGPRHVRISGLALAYDGSAVAHRLRALELASDYGKLGGEVNVAATAPFATEAALTLAGDGRFAGMQAKLALTGPLERLVARAQGSAGAARFVAGAEVTPFAPTPLSTLNVDASDVDLAAFDPRLPTTALGLAVNAKPEGSGFAGTLAATNATPGTLDAGRLPLISLNADFVQTPTALALDGLAAALPGGGRASGRGRIEFTGGAPMTWALTLAGVDLSRVHSVLLPTQLAGTLSADLDARAQRITGDLADRGRGLTLAFAATVADRQVEVTRARVGAGGGTLEGRARVAFDGERAFSVDALASHFDPARFGAFPAGALDGTVHAVGTLAPAWRAAVDVKLAPGAKFAGLAAAGKARATLTARTLHDADIDLKVGATRFAARGSAGEAGDRLEFALDARNLAELAPLLAGRVPQPLAGALRAQGVIRAEPGALGVVATAHGEGLKAGTLASFGSVDAKVDIAPRGKDARADYAEREFRASVTATRVTVSGATLATAQATIDGTLGQHTLRANATGDGFALDASAHGGLSRTDRVETIAWNGTLDTAVVRGTYPFRLASPAPVAIARSRVQVGATEVAIADGELHLGEFTWDDGRIATRGAFEHVPIAGLSKLAGQALPLASTLVVAGEWSLAATPRLSGTLAVRREQGDLFATQNTALESPDLALGLRTLALDARIRDDALDATATLRSERAGNADATLAVAAGARPGRIAFDAPMALALRAELESLAPLQAWLGTLAVLRGRASVDLAGKGSLSAPVFSGRLEGSGLRFDAAQYGMHFSDGRLRATLADNVATLDELELTGGSGRFTAQGTLARADVAGSGRVTWHAENFRLLNRPDLRLVVGGDGMLAIAERKLTLNGNVAVVEGRIEYEPARGTVLADDVVIKGRPRRSVEPAAPLPLALDLEVDLGQRLEFEGDSITTGLAGRVRVTTGPAGRLQGRGTIDTVNGSYFAFGQRLTIERGRLIFDGPLDNPALDIVALRKNLAVEAGVQLTGTVQVPQVRLTSNPPVPDGEKLSWLVTGQGVGRGTGTDAAALAAASAMLLGSNRPIGAQVAQQFGLDDISVRGSSNATGVAGSPGANAQVVAFGKRLTDRLTIVYEQGLTIATNALRLEYQLSRSITLRAEAGTVSGVGVYYRHSFE